MLLRWPSPIARSIGLITGGQISYQLTDNHSGGVVLTRRMGPRSNYRLRVQFLV